MDFEKNITALISTSPLHCNPSTEIIDETYYQLRKHLPNVDVVLLMDGVHPEEMHLAARYEEFQKAIGKKTWNNFRSIGFCEWMHQSGMLRDILLDHSVVVQTPLIFWSEHDIPLLSAPIDWEGIVASLLDREVDSVRFELTGQGKPNKEHERFTTRHKVPLLRTTQHVAWPQVIRTEYMKNLVRTFGTAKTYYDDGRRDGFLDSHVCGIYTPPGDIRRCYHISGRERNNDSVGKPYIEILGHKEYWGGIPYKPAQ